MDAKEFAKGYDKAVMQFGRAPDDMIKLFASELSLNPAHNNDHILADFLMDHEDPREAIVRRDISYRGDALGSYGKNEKEHQRALIGDFVSSVPIISGNDEVSIHKFEGNKGTAYRFVWGPGAALYESLFSPEEAEPILQHFGVKER